jgi:Tfp pilus assembly protein PilO
MAVHAAAAVGACVGAYALLVSPAAKELSAARAEMAGLGDQVRQADSLDARLPAMMRELKALKAESAKFERASAPVRNERDLFAAISALAQKSGVRIDQMAPSKGVAPARGALPGDAAVRCSITAVGPYGALAAFLRAMRRELGFTAVRSVRVSPLADDHASAVRAVIETEHFALDTSPPPAESDPSAGGGK